VPPGGTGGGTCHTTGTAAHTAAQGDCAMSTINREALRRIENLPTLPAVLTQVLQTVSDPNSSALDLGQKIIADQSMAGTILRLVNSAYYGFHRRISNIHEAIALLGFSTVTDMVLAASVFRQFSGKSSGFDRGQLWQHAMGVGMASDHLAKSMKVNNCGSMYSAGLLHDIGKVALDWLEPDMYAQMAEQAVESGQTTIEAERAAFATDHCEVGSVLAARWNLPSPVVEAIRLHHEPEESVEYPKPAYIVAWADALSYEAGLGAPGNGHPPGLIPAGPDLAAPSNQLQEEVIQELTTSAELIDTLLGALRAA
jgi:putative nucleotidyltransferase with HDIG domain